MRCPHSVFLQKRKAEWGALPSSLKAITQVQKVLWMVNPRFEMDFFIEKPAFATSV